MSSPGISPTEKNTFRNLIEATRNCLAHSDGTWESAIACETAIFSENSRYTYHTHPNGTPAPSDKDRQTTAKFGKEWLIIGLVPTNEVVYFHKSDNYHKLRGRFKV